MQYYEDRWTGSIYSLAQLARLIEAQDVLRAQVPRRFRVLPEQCCRVLHEAELIAGLVDRDRGQLSA